MKKTNKKVMFSFVATLALSVSAYAVCANDIDMRANKITTTATTFNDDQQFITKKYVDDSLKGADDAKGFMTDHEGWIHPTVKIGDKTWMADNLYVTTFSGGGDHSVGDAIDSWDNNKNNTFSYPSDVAYGSGGSETTNRTIIKQYGMLYQYQTAVDDTDDSEDYTSNTVKVQGICPSGWRVPSHQDWIDLEVALDSDANTDTGSTSWQKHTVGAKAKAGGTSGLNVVLSGFRDTLGTFYNRGIGTSFWSASEGGSDAWGRNFAVSHDDIYRNKLDKKNGFSVRCMKD